MKRAFAIAGATLLAVAVAAIAFGPHLIQRYAESKVDQALARMRVQTTSVVNRGAVTVDLSNRALTIRDLGIESAGREQRIGVASLTIVRPREAGRLLTAERVIFEDVTVKSAGETITVPRIEIDNYSGPERGLTATPGIGRNARTQADLIHMVSLERAVAPVVLVTGDDTALRRTLRNVAINRVAKGLVESATVDGVALQVPYISPEQSPETSSMTVSAGPLVYQGVDLPTLWRFYAGDGAGDRQPFLKSGVVANVQSVTTLRPGGEIRASWRRLTVDGVTVRPLGFPVTTFDPFATKLRVGEAVTPAEVRQQLLFGADGLRAIAFDRVAIEGAKLEIAREDEPRRSLDVASAEIGPYAEGRLGAVKAQGVDYRAGDLIRLSLKSAALSGFDATGLLGYADRIGRDEALLTMRPTAVDVVRYAPRLSGAEATGLAFCGPAGGMTAAAVRVEANAPAEEVPQHVAFTLDDLDAHPAPGSWGAKTLSEMRLDALTGGLSFALTLDPTKKTLSLNRFDYRFAQLGSLTATGEMSSVDPLLAVASGADFVDKFSAIELGMFKLTLADDGAVETILRRTADAARTPVELYREEVARDAQEQIFRLFGPPAENSAESAARFIRDPRRVEVVVTPRGTSPTLLNLIRAFDLGPAGIAQVIDLSVLYKR